jgi:serine phosphatase RsbU (regulator of sigma subunit)
MGNHVDGMKYFENTLRVADELGDKEIALEALEGLANTYADIGDYRRAFTYSARLIDLKDTVYSQEGAARLAEMEVKFDTEREEKEIKLLTKEKKIQDLELLKQNQDINRQRLIIYSSIGSAVLLSLLVFFIFRGYREKQKANLELRLAYQVIEEKNKDITDSISYASRIQAAILPDTDIVKQILPGSFVLYMPKDIVSGDFYWIAQKHGKVLIAAADCTGHGVPGAFMSMVGNTLLNEIVNEKGITSPEQVLDHLRAGIIKSLKQRGSEGENKDGMDIAMCILDKDNTLEYAGAHNPPWIVRKDASEVELVKADKQPIGIYKGTPAPFTKHVVKLHPGDAFYIFSDGYVDQFGGNDGKKFMTKRFKDLLISIRHEPIADQGRLLGEAIESWKGSREQVDDILVIGVKV